MWKNIERIKPLQLCFCSFELQNPVTSAAVDIDARCHCEFDELYESIFFHTCLSVHIVIRVLI